ncbi:Alpha/Beta hydrolase protein [Phaeosphaeriaceae sp. PMI808]|nr:Alpha/Beta hydrolase protein [Phaeosphaeriaceae sp. PMI808]
MNDFDSAARNIKAHGQSQLPFLDAPHFPPRSHIFLHHFTNLTNMSSKSQPPVHSAPLIFSPLQAHKTTLVILHGRGSTAQKFAEPFLTHAVSPPPTATNPLLSPSTRPMKSLHDHLPNTKFVFPTAPLRRAVVFKRSLTHQWFDDWSVTQPELKQHLQVPGLRETTSFLHELLSKEIGIIGAENVVLVGLSQGCAASIVATLLWEGNPFGGLVGMCGYLPFRKGMYDLLHCAQNEENDVDDIFERDSEDSEGENKFEEAVAWLREELEIQREGNKEIVQPPMQSTPVFMGHGMGDEKVPYSIGRMAAEFLKDIGVNIEWAEYEGLGHWYSEEMLRDIVQFLNTLKGWRDQEMT